MMLMLEIAAPVLVFISAKESSYSSSAAIAWEDFRFLLSARPARSKENSGLLHGYAQLVKDLAWSRSRPGQHEA
jgi:hypothetical protein